MRGYKLYIDDMQKAVRKIEKYTKGLTFDKLKENDLIIDGVARNLEIINSLSPWQIMYTLIHRQTNNQ